MTDRAKRAQPSGYTPPEVGAPTWPRERSVGLLGRPIPTEGELIDRLFAERDRLRGVIAAADVDLLAGRVDEATGALRAAGGQP